MLPSSKEIKTLLLKLIFYKFFLVNFITLPKHFNLESKYLQLLKEQNLPEMSMFELLKLVTTFTNKRAKILFSSKLINLYCYLDTLKEPISTTEDFYQVCLT